MKIGKFEMPKHNNFVHLEGFRYFGKGNPIAIIYMGEHKYLYTRLGIDDLKIKFKSYTDIVDSLDKIIGQMNVVRYTELPDLSQDDLSGQKSLF